MAASLSISGTKFAEVAAGVLGNFTATPAELGELTVASYAWSVVANPADKATIVGNGATAALSNAVGNTTAFSAVVTCVATLSDDSTVTATFTFKALVLDLEITGQLTFPALNADSEVLSADLTGSDASLTNHETWSLAAGADTVTLTPDVGGAGATLDVGATAAAQVRALTLHIDLYDGAVDTGIDVEVTRSVWIVGALTLSGDTTVFANLQTLFRYLTVLTAPAVHASTYAWSITAQNPAASAELVAVAGNAHDIDLKPLKAAGCTLTLSCTVNCKSRSADVYVERTATLAVTLVDLEFPGRCTGAAALLYIAACSADVQATFASLCARRGVTIANDSNVLGSVQLACIFDAI